MAGKNHELRVKLSAEELIKIKKKASELGMAPSAFLRFLGLISDVTADKIEIESL